MWIILFAGILLGWMIHEIHTHQEPDLDIDETTLEQVADYMIETFENKQHLNHHAILYRWAEGDSLVEKLLRVAEDYERVK